jgi:hypothetical protein
MRETLRKSLPEHMVPSAFVTLAALPLTASGKVDRRALPLPEGEAIPGRPYAPPATPTEEVLSQIWSHVLGVPRVGRHDHFWDLGGHSLLATQTVSRIRRDFAVDLPLRALFDAPGLSGLALAIDQARHRPAAGAPRLAPSPRTGRCRSPMRSSASGSSISSSPAATPTTCLWPCASLVPMNTEALERALARVVARHESLRTRFESRDGQPVQVIETESLVSLVLGEADPLELPGLLHAECVRPFDLTVSPLLRATLYRTGPDDHTLLLNAHHVVSDGWSTGVLLDELWVLYAEEAEGVPARLRTLPVQYADYALWQREWLAGGEMERQLGYWEDRLAGAAPLALPVDLPRPAMKGNRGARHAFEVPLPVLQGLREVARQEGATLFMVLLAAFQTVLGRWPVSTTSAWAPRSRAARARSWRASSVSS